MKRPFLPYARHSIDASDIEAVALAMQSGWLTQGPAIDAFEDALCEATGAAHMVACSSGTAALHAAYAALDIGPGDVVIVPAITFLATASMVRLTGAEVVFADVAAKDGLMHVEHLERAIAEAGNRDLGTVRAVAPVYLGGQVGDPEAISAYAASLGLMVVEDACHALGTQYADGAGALHRVGACAHAAVATFSFHPAKTVAAGEGGAIATNDPKIAAACRELICHGMVRDPNDFIDPELSRNEDGDPNPWSYELHRVGLNYRASDIHCALGISQLKRLDAFVAQRHSLAAHYRARLANGMEGVSAVDAPAADHVCWHLNTVLIDFDRFGISRRQLMLALRELGIGTQVHYIPVSSQPYYRDRYGDADLPGAAAYYDRCLSLPLFAGMSTADVDYVVDSLFAVLGEG